MSILTKNAILNRIEKGDIVINPFNEDLLNPNSVDLTLSKHLKCYAQDRLDSKSPNKTIDFDMDEDGMVLNPNTVYLARTNEWTETYNLVPKLDGKSSIGRLGLSIHITAGFGDIGFKGFWTLELSCVQPVRIYPNMKICQINYWTLETAYRPIENYKGKYQNQSEVIASKNHKDYE